MSYDPSQPPNPNQGPYYEYSDYSYYNPYGASQDPYGAPYGAPGGPPPATPLPLGEAVEQLPGQYWKALTRPGATTFAEESGKAAWDITWLQLIGYAIIAAVLAVANAFISQAATTAFLNGLNSSSGRSFSAIAGSSASPALTIVTSLVGTLAGFFIGQGILFGLAKAFGGQGTFTQQAYIFLLFQVPLGILEGLFQLIPIAGSLIVLAGGIYEIVLSVFAIMGVHRLSGGKASAVVLIPIGVAFLLVCALIFILVAVALNSTNLQR